MASERTLLRVSLAVLDATAEPVGEAGILIEDRAVASVGKFQALRRAYPLARERDRRGLIALPGFVDAHSHGRGLALVEQGVRPGPLELFLARLTACTPLDPYDHAFVAGAELLATGVTAAQVFFHSFAHADAYRDEARVTAAGLAASGLDFELVLGITDRDEFVPPAAGDAPKEARPLVAPSRGLGADEFFELFDAFTGPEGRRPTLGPVAPQWCSEAIWNGVAARARSGVRVHTHLLESRAQRAAFGSTPVETLERCGVLGERLSAAHAVWLTPEEPGLFATRGAALVHCPSSNQRLGVGTAPVRSFLDAGVEVALGLDSNSRVDPPDLFDELRLARQLAEGRLSARDALSLATHGGAAALGRPDLGRLRAGAAASIVLLPLPEPGAEPLEGVLAHAGRGDVVEVWAQGSPVIEQGRLRNQSEVEAARARLRADLQRDLPARRRRLAAIADVEPWLSEVWRLDTN